MEHGRLVYPTCASSVAVPAVWLPMVGLAFSVYLGLACCAASDPILKRGNTAIHRFVVVVALFCFMLLPGRNMNPGKGCACVNAPGSLLLVAVLFWMSRVVQPRGRPESAKARDRKFLHDPGAVSRQSSRCASSIAARGCFADNSVFVRFRFLR